MKQQKFNKKLLTSEYSDKNTEQPVAYIITFCFFNKTLFNFLKQQMITF